MTRIAQLKARLARRDLDGFLISQPDNRRFISGFSAADHSIQESAGVLFIPRRGMPILLTDSRFALDARQEAAGFSVRTYSKGMLPLLSSILEEYRSKRLGFDSHYTLHSTSEELLKICHEIDVEPVATTGIVESMRLCKSAEELQKLQGSVTMNETVFQEVHRTMQPGMTEIEIAMHIETLMRQRGAEKPSFDTIVASGANGASPHAVPGQRQIKAGEPIVIDMGLVLDGYCSDMTRTVVLGKPAAKTAEIIRIVRKAQLAGMAAIRAGVTGRQVDQAARKIIKDAGYGDCFGHGLGHGVGLAVHEGPNLSPRYTRKLQVGMVVTVEPGIYIEGWGGVRLENMVVVTREGCRNLNRDTTCLDI
ncbi:MAG: Xaa-Pro peptidase family protein [Desulfobulbaceae bacterium]|jgi:Xaa-Pro aminopeptidase|nr:Xaa-Pro peptidase family protein [Desulfobulbaceae bacterium]